MIEHHDQIMIDNDHGGTARSSSKHDQSFLAMTKSQIDHDQIMIDNDGDIDTLVRLMVHDHKF